MKILWHGVAPWMGTGYGQQTALTVPRLRAAGHNVVISAYAGCSTPTVWNGIDVYPGDHDFGNEMLVPYIERFEPDLTVSLLDPWVLRPKPLADHRVACWTPVDHEPMSVNLARFFEHSGAQPLSMSRFGDLVMRDAGLQPIHVPHGIDTAVFSPRDRAEARDEFDIPLDAFVVGMIATNTDSVQPRKGWVEALRAFAEFRRRHPEAVMYLHTRLSPKDGINIPVVAEALGLGPEAFRGTGQLDYMVNGISQDTMATLHSAFDVLLSPSYGEGFGLAPVEAQACGVPVIVSDASAQRELCGAGWLVETDQEWVNAYRAWWQRPLVSSIVDALEQAYTADRAVMAVDARAFAMNYDADRVFETYWQPALAALGPQPNREQRRALAKAAR